MVAYSLQTPVHLNPHSEINLPWSNIVFYCVLFIKGWQSVSEASRLCLGLGRKQEVSGLRRGPGS